MLDDEFYPRTKYLQNNTEIYQISFRQKLTPSRINDRSHFGHAVLFHKNIGLVSAYDSAGAGIVYVFKKIYYDVQRRYL